MHNSANYRVGAHIRRFVLIFYPPCRKICSEQFFVYGICGAANTLFSWVLYWFLYNFVLHKENLDLGFLVFKPHIAAFFIQFVITFLSGFWLNRYVSFSSSPLKKRVQIPRYMAVVIACILINYWGLKLFVEVIGIYPTPSQMLNTLATTFVSFFSQKYFAFKSR